jgi:anti-sigma factor RsiW
MKCEEVHPNLGAFVLGRLESEEETEVRGHLAFCPSCREVLKEFEEVRGRSSASSRKLW